MLKRSVVGVLGLLGVAAATPGPAEAQQSAYQYTFQSIDGQPLPLSQFQGKVLLVVNTASFCGFTPQYTALQKLHERFEPEGLVVIGVPSNDFGGQEPKSDGEVKAFCQGAFGITFPLTAKYRVTGSEKHPFYAWASQELGAMNGPWWNFHKYLVGRDGRLVTSFGSRTDPGAANVMAAIKEQLERPTPTAVRQE